MKRTPVVVVVEVVVVVVVVLVVVVVGVVGVVRVVVGVVVVVVAVAVVVAAAAQKLFALRPINLLFNGSLRRICTIIIIFFKYPIGNGRNHPPQWC